MPLLMTSALAAVLAAAAQIAPSPTTPTQPVGPVTGRPDDAAASRSGGASQAPRVTLPATSVTTSGTAAPAPAAAGVTVYPASFFAQYRLNTALDMINRTPGFNFDAGDSVRGFAGAAGNVLIDGARPASKSDSLDTILNRIVVGEVDRIEVIRGGAPGIDMQGRTVIANVIRKSGDRQRVTLSYTNNLFDDGHTIPGGALQYSRQVGKHTFEASLTRTQGYDDSVGDGRIVTTTHPGAPDQTVTSEPARTSASGGGVDFSTTYKGPQLGGDLRVNFKVYEEYFKNGLSYGDYPPNDIINDRQRNRSGEFGLNFDRNFGPWQTESVLLQRLDRTFFGEAETTSPPLASSLTLFSQVNDSSESIGRFVLRRAFTPKLTLEAGAEGAYNTLDGHTRLTQDGAPLPLPSQDVRVEEIRGEGYVQARWQPTSKLTLEGALRFEGSNIAETGDATQERTFYYLKPRGNLTWNLSPDDQLRLRIEKKVGQLNFASFVTKTDLTASTVNAGNPDLRPDQRWQYEAAYEKHFWKRGSLVVTYLHEEIDDVSDLVAVIGPGYAFDAPGNIGSGTNDQLSILATVPLDKLGVSGGLLKTTTIWRNSEVTDPLTGEKRRISGQRPDDLEAEFTQDILHLKSTWGINWFNGWRETYYRVGEVQHFRIPPTYLGAFWEYKPQPGLSIRLRVQNLLPFTFQRKRTIYEGARGLSPIEAQEDRVIQSQPRIEFRIRKTFG